MRDPKHARQASLLALLQRHEGGLLSRAVIVESIEGYEGSDETVRKRLQRDLAELRNACDLEVEYVQHPITPGYRIRRRPLELDLDAQDLAMLALVAASLGPQDRPALHLEALGAPPPGVVGVVASIEPGPQLPMVLRAIDQRCRLDFAYRKPGAPRSEQRQVLPWGVVYRGGWYVIGYCLTRKDERAFKLSRIDGEASVADPVSYEVPARRLDVSEPWVGGEHTAKIAVDPAIARAATRRLHAKLVDGDYERPVLEAPYADEASFVSFLAGFGDAIEVLEPLELRSALAKRLQAIVEVSA